MGAHFSYVDIYFSKQIKMSEGDLEGQFQTSLHGRIMNFFKSENSNLLYSFFLAEVFKFTAFCTLLLIPGQKFKILLLKKVGWKSYYCPTFWLCGQKLGW